MLKTKRSAGCDVVVEGPLSWVLSAPGHPSNKSVEFPGRKIKHAWFECGELGRKSKITSPGKSNFFFLKKNAKRSASKRCDVLLVGSRGALEYARGAR